MLRKCFFLLLHCFIINVAAEQKRNLSDTESRIASGEFRKACSSFALITPPLGRVDTTERLKALRKLMSTPSLLRNSQTLKAVLVTSHDEHQSRFVSNYDKRREYISGFSGVKGDAIVTMDDAALWVDRKYHFQANNQLDCNWLLMRQGNPLVPSMAEWLKSKFPNGTKIGADPKLLSADEWNNLEKDLQRQNTNLTLVKTDEFNLIDEIWNNHNETEQEKEAFTVDDIYSGKPWTEKVHELRLKLKELNVSAMVVTALDEIAWLLNVRGRDIPYTRFVKSYVLLSEFEIYFYVHQSKVKDNVTIFFNAKYPGITKYTITIKDYDAFWTDLPTNLQIWHNILLPSLLVYSPGVSKAVYDLVSPKQRVSLPSPIIHMKAVKNPIEINGMRQAHIRDGAAMCKFMEYLEVWYEKKDTWNELKAALDIDKFRLEEEPALNNSFPTVVAFGAHGAYPDYEPSTSTSNQLFDNSTIVIHSGGQYPDGTTDVSRTLHLGNPTDLQKESYTRTLIGLIQLSSLTIPDYLPMSSVDIFARAPIWEIGEDYPYPTGHGIGAFLGVQESPIKIDYNSRITEVFKPGYFFTCGPGIYREDQFGVRLENVLEVVKRPHVKHYYGHSYLGFKDVTLVPYCRKLIKIELLSVQHRRWLNKYNARIRKYVGAELKRRNSIDAFYWMMDNTKHIPEYGHASIISSKSVYMLMVNVIISNMFVCILY